MRWIGVPAFVAMCGFLLFLTVADAFGMDVLEDAQLASIRGSHSKGYCDPEQCVYSCMDYDCGPVDGIDLCMDQKAFPWLAKYVCKADVNGTHRCCYLPDSYHWCGDVVVGEKVGNACPANACYSDPAGACKSDVCQEGAACQ